MVRPKERGEAGTGAGPGVAGEVGAVRGGIFREIKYTVVETDPVEGF